MIEPMWQWARDMWRFPRSITGEGVRQTIRYLQELIPGLEMHSVPSGMKVLDWVTPDEWNVRDAYIMDADGNRVIDWNANNLHLVGYSEPLDEIIDKWELQTFLHSLPDRPEVIPYITSYYKRRWGFCLSDNQRRAMKDGLYRVVIDSTLEPGELNYADIVIPGESDKEVLISTYICHPMMANDNLSGIVVTASLARWLASLTDRKLTYRIVFIPETIGAIVYLDKHLQHLKEKVVAGYVITCCGAGRQFTLIHSRHGYTLSDRVAMGVLLKEDRMAIRTWSERGSDERQYCWPGVDLPIASITQAKYGEYREYHTSADNLNFISQEKLEESLDLYKKCLTVIDCNRKPKTTTVGEPFLTRHGLYPQSSPNSVPDMLNVLSYCDGENDINGIRLETGLDYGVIISCLNELESAGLVK